MNPEPHTFWWNGKSYTHGFWYVDTYGHVLFTVPVEGGLWVYAENQSLEGLVPMGIVR